MQRSPEHSYMPSLCPHLGLRIDNEVVRVAMGLCLGVTLCHPHVCQHCHNQVDHQGLHGLSCRKIQGRHPRHAAINDIIRRSLTSAGCPLTWSQSASAYHTGNGRMEPQLCHGILAGSLCGMQPALTPMAPPTPRW